MYYQYKSSMLEKAKKMINYCLFKTNCYQFKKEVNLIEQKGM